MKGRRGGSTHSRQLRHIVRTLLRQFTHPRSSGVVVQQLCESKSESELEEKGGWKEGREDEIELRETNLLVPLLDGSVDGREERAEPSYCFQNCVTVRYVLWSNKTAQRISSSSPNQRARRRSNAAKQGGRRKLTRSLPTPVSSSSTALLYACPAIAPSEESSAAWKKISMVSASRTSEEVIAAVRGGREGDGERRQPRWREKGEVEEGGLTSHSIQVLFGVLLKRVELLLQTVEGEKGGERGRAQRRKRDGQLSPFLPPILILPAAFLQPTSAGGRLLC